MFSKKRLCLAAVMLAAVFLVSCAPASHENGIPVGPSPDGQVKCPPDVIRARDAALGFVQKTYSIAGLTELSEWTVMDITQPNIVGQGAYEFICGAWMVAISYPVVALEHRIYTVSIQNAASDFIWSGMVYPDGTVIEPEVNGLSYGMTLLARVFGGDGAAAGGNPWDVPAEEDRPHTRETRLAQDPPDGLSAALEARHPMKG